MSNVSDPDSVAKLAELATSAYLNRLKAAASGHLEQLEDALASLPEAEMGWRCRLLVEASNHRRRISKDEDPKQWQQSEAEAREAYELALRLNEPLLLGLATREWTRWDSSGDSNQQLALLVNAYGVVRDALMSGFQSRYGSQLGGAARFLAGAAGLRYARRGDRDEQLRILRDAQGLPGLSARLTVMLIGLELSTLKYMDRLAERDDVLDSLEARTDLGDEGRALLHASRGRAANLRQAWGTAASEFEKAAALSKRVTDRGNRWNHAAYNAFRAKNLDAAESYLDHAASAWAEMKKARTGESITRRTRARVAEARGDLQLAVQLLLENMEILHKKGSTRYPVACVALLEVLAAEPLAAATLARDRTARFGSTVVSASDFESVYLETLGMTTPGSIEHSRAAIAYANLVLAEVAPEPSGFLSDLTMLAESRPPTGRWRAAQLWMAASRLRLRHGDVGDALSAALLGIEAYFASRNGIREVSNDLADLGWVNSNHVADYHYAWALATAMDDGGAAARIAEARAASLILQLLQEVPPGEAPTAVDRAADITGREAMRGPSPSRKSRSERHRTLSEISRAIELIAEPDDEVDTTADAESDEEAEQNPDARHAARAAARLESAHKLQQLTPLVTLNSGSQMFDPTAEPSGRYTLYLALTESQQILFTLVRPDGSVRVRPPHRLPERSSTWLAEFREHASRLRTLRESPRETRRVLRELGDLLLPTDAEIGGSLGDDVLSLLQVCPTGALWSIPWAALSTREGQAIDRFVLTVVPSSAVAKHLSERELPLRRSAEGYFSTVLRSSRYEARRFKKAFGSGCHVYSHPTELLSELARRELVPDVLALACHGDAGDDTGLAHRLELEPGLQVSFGQMLELNFGRRTILGSCWLGTVSETLGVGPLGTVLPVLHGGGNVLLAGLFNIEDRSTSRVLAVVYEHVARGQSLPSALQKAQSEWSSRWWRQRSPWRWAGLVCVGVDC